MSMDRPQDRWNSRNGYFSKSYKLGKGLTDSFALACEGTKQSQAGILSGFMQQYVNSFYERTVTMKITAKFYGDIRYEHLIQEHISTAIGSISSQDIAEMVHSLDKEISGKKVGDKIYNEIKPEYDFNVPVALGELSLEGDEIALLCKKILVREVALFNLLEEKRIMPVRLQSYDEININISYKGGNAVFTLEMDLLPFGVFIVIP